MGCLQVVREDRLRLGNQRGHNAGSEDGGEVSEKNPELFRALGFYVGCRRGSAFWRRRVAIPHAPPRGCN